MIALHPGRLTPMPKRTLLMLSAGPLLPLLPIYRRTPSLPLAKSRAGCEIPERTLMLPLLFFERARLTKC